MHALTSVLFYVMNYAEVSELIKVWNKRRLVCESIGAVGISIYEDLRSTQESVARFTVELQEDCQARTLRQRRDYDISKRRSLTVIQLTPSTFVPNHEIVHRV